MALLKEINHPELKLKTGDTITTEREGHYRTKGDTHEAYSPATDVKEVEIIRFSKEIVEELDHGRKTNLFDELVIIAQPHLNGLLHQQLNKNIKNLIINNIKKDIMCLDNKELLSFLKEHAKYHDQP